MLSGSPRAKERVLQGGLVLVIVLISSVALATLSPGPSSGGNGPTATSTVSPPLSSGNGMLNVVVQVSTVSHSADSSLQSQVSLPSNVTFIAVSIGSRFPTRQVIEVAQPGSFEVPLPSGNYTVSTANPFYNLSALVPIQPNARTQLTVQVVASRYQADRVVVAEPDLTGYVQTWGNVSMLFLTEAPPVHQGGLAYLEVERPNYITFLCYLCANGENQTLVQIGTFSEQLKASAVETVSTAENGAWVTLSPRTSLYLPDSSGLTLDLVSANSTVSSGV